MLMLTLAITYLTTSNLPWLIDRTFQVPTQYCSLQHLNLLSPPDTSTTRHHFHFIDMKWSSDSSFLLKLFVLSWSISSSIEHWAEDPQIGEQLYKISSHTFAKVLGHTTDFPTWGSSKGTENPRGIWRQVELDNTTSTGLGKQTLGGHKQNFLLTMAQEKWAVTQQEIEPDQARKLWWRCRLTEACLEVRNTDYNSLGSHSLLT